MELSKTFGREPLTDWMERNEYDRRNMSAMVMHGDRITAILTKDNKIHHSNGLIEPHITKLSAISRMETLAEEQDRKMAEKDEILYNLANLISRNISIFSDEDRKEILIFLSELKTIDPKLYDFLIGENDGV